MLECRLEKNRAQCTCTYDPCERKGKCCECMTYHKEMRQLPGCFFSPEGERSYDRSIQRFLSENK